MLGGRIARGCGACDESHDARKGGHGNDHPFRDGHANPLSGVEDSRAASHPW